MYFTSYNIYTFLNGKVDKIISFNDSNNSIFLRCYDGFPNHFKMFNFADYFFVCHQLHTKINYKYSFYYHEALGI